MAEHARKDERRRWLKARGLKTTGRKQELIDRVIKAKVDGRRSKKEKRERKMFEKLELLKNCAVHQRIFQILKLWTTGQTICLNCHRLVIKKLSTTWFMDRANSSKAGKIWNVLNNWKHSNFLRTGGHVQKIELRLISEKSSYIPETNHFPFKDPQGVVNGK